MPRDIADIGPFVWLTHTLHAATTPCSHLHTMLRSCPARNAVSALRKPQACRQLSATAPTAAISPYRRTGKTLPPKADVVRRGQSTAAATAPYVRIDPLFARLSIDCVSNADKRGLSRVLASTGRLGGMIFSHYNINRCQKWMNRECGLFLCHR